MGWVSYLGLENHESNALAKRLLRPNVFGGVLSFGVKGTKEQAAKVVDNLKLASHLANLGGYYRFPWVYATIVNIRSFVF